MLSESRKKMFLKNLSKAIGLRKNYKEAVFEEQSLSSLVKFPHLLQLFDKIPPSKRKRCHYL